MGLLNLIARLSLNTSGFQQGLKRSEGMASKTATHISGEFRKTFLRSFGAGAAIAGVTSMLRSTAQYAASLTALARKHGITTDEVQHLQNAAKEAGMTFEDYATAIEKAGVSLSDFIEKSGGMKGNVALTVEDVKNIETFTNAMEKAKGKMQSFIGGVISNAATVGAGISSVADSIRGKKWGAFAEIRNMPSNFNKGVDAHNDAEVQKHIDDNAARLGPAIPPGFFDKKKAEKETPLERISMSVDKPNVNSLQQMGAFAANNQTVTEQKKANQILTRIEKNTASGGGDIYQ